MTSSATIFSPPCDAYRFGPFRLSVPDRILERDGERIQLTPKVIDTLFVLIEHSGQVVTKEALMKAVWPDVTVVESGLTRNLSVLRKALEEGREEGAFIETIPRRGYRFVVPVEEEEPRTEPFLEPAREAPTSPEPRQRRPSWIWMTSGGVVVAAIACFGAFANRDRNVERPAVEPFVRIGEHLLYKMAPEETIRALDHFERAIAENPRSASAHAGLSIALLQLSQFGVWLPAERMRPVAEAAKKAVDLDPGSATAHYSLAMVRAFKDWDFAAADAEFRRALQLEPDSVQTRFGYARLKQITGDLADARRLVEEALRLDPASPPLGVEYCRVFYYQRDFRRAESECRKVLDREPSYALAHYYLALSLGSLGRIEDADRSLRDSGLMPAVVEADRAWLSLRGGDRGPALAALETRRDLMRRGKVDATAKLLLAAALDRNEEAYEALEAGLATRAPDLLTIHIEPRLDSIRRDARYPGVLRRIGIPRKQ